MKKDQPCVLDGSSFDNRRFLIPLPSAENDILFFLGFSRKTVPHSFFVACIFSISIPVLMKELASFLLSMSKSRDLSLR